MIDPSAEAFTREGIALRGVAVTFQRISGTAPRTFKFSADVVASIESASPDTEEVARTGYSARSPGAISQNDRNVIVMACDLKAARFPLPLRKGDKLIVKSTADRFTVARVDALKRAFSGAIELVVTGAP